MNEIHKYKILVKPKWLRFFGLLYNSSQVIFPYILIPSSLVERLSKKDPYSLSIIEHEIVHFNRMKEIGAFKWYFSYIFSLKFRLGEEVAAYRRQRFVLEGHGISFDLEKYATILSSWVYLKMISNEKARRLLQANKCN